MLSNIVVGAVLALCIALAVRYVIKVKKSGGCVGCPGGAGCAGCAKHTEKTDQED